MHPVAGEVAAAHRLKGAGANVQRQARHHHALVAQALQQRVVEVQAGGGRGHRAGVGGVHRLVALLVVAVRRPVDVRRQGHAPVTRQHLRHRRVELQQVELAATAHHVDGHILHEELASGAQRLARTRLAERPGFVQHTLHEQFGAAAGILARQQPRFDDAGIVHHQHIFRRQQIQYGAEAAMQQFVAVQHQQAALGARGRRPLGDEFRRQREVEIGCARRRGRGAGGGRNHSLALTVPRRRASPAPSIRRVALWRRCRGRSFPPPPLRDRPRAHCR